jgi:uncharacterized oxidoreductase
MELTNNTILITGGTSGFGLEFATRLIDLGNTVIITGRDQEKLEQTKKRLPAIHTFQSDVSDPRAIKELYEKVTSQFPALNVLINNAGEMRKILLQDGSRDLLDITREIEINLMGPIRMVQQFLPHLIRQRSPVILNVTSGLALVPFPISPIYGATKSGLRSYTRSLRVQLKNTPVRVIELVAPGADTPLNDKFAGVDGFNPKAMMKSDQLIAVAIRGMQKDKDEIYPGISRVLRVMTRLAPAFIFRQTSRVGALAMASSRLPL